MEFVWIGVALCVFVAIFAAILHTKKTEEEELVSYDYLKKIEREPLQGKKIFCIGNSYSDDSVRYIPEVLYGLNQNNFVIANVYIGGAPLELHAQNIAIDAPAYEYRKFKGEWTNTPKVSILQALMDEDWDLVVLQQQSAKAGVSQSYSPYLQQIIEYVKEHCPKAKIAFNMTWAYPSYSKCGAFEIFDCSVKKMYESIASVMTSRIEPNFDFSFVIPTGTALQNARTVIEDKELFRDDIHLSNKGRFLASMAWVKELYGLDMNNLQSVIEEVSIQEAQIFVKAVESAYKHPYVVTEIE